MRKTYDLTLDNNGTADFSLRLTLAGQTKLKKKHGGDPTMQTLGEAVTDAETAADVLTEALAWAGNTNSLHSGADLYDLLVDNGYAGPADFAKLFISGIGVSSGILSQDMADKIVAEIAGEMDKALADTETDAKNG